VVVVEVDVVAVVVVAVVVVAVVVAVVVVVVVVVVVDVVEAKDFSLDPEKEFPNEPEENSVLPELKLSNLWGDGRKLKLFVNSFSRVTRSEVKLSSLSNCLGDGRKLKLEVLNVKAGSASAWTWFAVRTSTAAKNMAGAARSSSQPILELKSVLALGPRRRDLCYHSKSR